MRAEPPLRQPGPNPAAARTPAPPAPPITQQPNMYTAGPAAVPAAPFITPPKKKKKNSWKALYLYEKVLIICVPLIFLGVLLNVNNDPTYHLDWVVNALPIIPFIVSFIKKEKELRDSPVIGIVFMVILGVFLFGLTFDMFDRIKHVNNVNTYSEWQEHLLVEDIIFLSTAVPLMARMIVDRVREAKHKAKNKAQNSVNMYR